MNDAESCFVDSKWAERGEFLRNLLDPAWYDDEAVYLDSDLYSSLNRLQIVIDEGYEEYKLCARRPYYQMRGKRLTEDQAFEVIRRTDEFFWSRFSSGAADDYEDYGYIPGGNFRNRLFEGLFGSWRGKGSGWVWPDGVVGCNDITLKWPVTLEFIFEWVRNKLAFPFLDLVVGVTSWDESPYDGNWGNSCFLNDIEVGIWVHDDAVEIMSPARTAATYKKYDKQYGKRPGYDYDRREHQDYHPGEPGPGMDYLKRCIEAYGLDAEEELKTVRNGCLWPERRF